MGEKIKNKLLSIVFVIILLFVIGLAEPAMRDVLWVIPILLWSVFKAFFLKDFVVDWGIKIAVLVIVNAIGAGIYFTRKERKKLIFLISGVLGILAMIFV